MKKILLPAVLLSTMAASGQLYIDNATFFIDNGAVVTVQGNVYSNTSIQVNGAAGTGKLRLAGTGNQELNLNGNTVPNLQIDNSAGNVVLTGAGKVGNSLEFTNGKVQLGNFDLTLAATATHSGAGTGKFAETNGTGVLKKEVTAAATVILPVGNGSNYSPLQYQLTGGSYSAAWVGARSVSGAHPNKHPRSSEYLNSYWDLSSNGITGGTKAATGTYVDAAGYTKDASGAETDIKAMVWNGTGWALGTTQDAAANTVTASVSGATQQLYGMNKFVLVSPKVFLEGPFNSATGLMNEGLRTNNLIPVSDPYRTTAGFTHTANSVVESVNASVFADQSSVVGSGPQNNIVDWVFVELRSTANPSVVQQTRAALIQRDGDIVDIDGKSEVYFKNVNDASYHLFVRHRNHLGVRTNAALALTLNSVAKDFTTAVSSAYTDASITTNGPLKSVTVNSAPNAWVMFGSNANADARTTKIGAAPVNDYSILLSGITSTLGYYRADYNMDGRVARTGPAALNDYSKILGTLSNLNTVTQHNQ